MKGHKNIEIKHPPVYSIIHQGNFDYIYLESYHDYAATMGIKQGEIIDSGAMHFLEYDKNYIDYMYVRAIHKYKDKYYFIPSSFSNIGTMRADRDWNLVTEQLNYSIEILNKKICEEICPGYLD